MQLPQTHYDVLQGLRPYVIQATEQDAAKLIALGLKSTVASSDDIDSQVDLCVDKAKAEMKERFARQNGIPLSNADSFFEMAIRQNPQPMITLLSAINYEYHALLNFCIFDKKVFYFADDATDKLANTEINLKADMINLPFPSCLFAFTSRTAVNALYNMMGEDGRRAMNAGDLDYSAPISVFLTMLPGGDLPGRKLAIVAFHARKPAFIRNMTSRILYLPDDWTLEQSLRTDWKKISPNNIGSGIRSSWNDQTFSLNNDDKSFYTDGLVFFRLVLNSILYLSSSEAEISDEKSPVPEIILNRDAIPSPKKRRQMTQAAERFSVLDYTKVGATVPPITLRSPESETESGASQGAGTRPQVRFLVRGHWRNQAHGPNRADRKIIWIVPFYKGPDIAEQVNKPYLVR